jgi:hypothetical protein
MTRKQSQKTAGTLTERDKEILRSLCRFRCLTTMQIRRLHFADAATPTAASRAANLRLSRLRELRLIDRLDRRVGGVRAGSASFTWGLDEAGHKMFDMRKTPRKRFFEPSCKFLTHTLAIAEVYVRLMEMPGVGISEAQPEPDCWRQYAGAGGAPRTLKPDLYTAVSCGEYEYCLFFEVDLATEPVTRVIAKCEQYLDYYRNGGEQRENGLFPVVVRLVPTEKRKEKIEDRMRDELPFTDIFRVVTPDELDSLMKNGVNIR